MTNTNAIAEAAERKYFRIDDVAIVHYKAVDKDDLKSTRNRSEKAVLNKLTLKARFDSMTRELRPMLTMIEKSSTTIATYLEAIDKKLNMLSEYVIETELAEMNAEPQQVNIGGGGLSFSADSPLLVGSMLELRLVLLPENTGVFTFAQVSICKKMDEPDKENNQYKIGLEFVDMVDDVRDLITRHVLAKEQASLINKA